MEPLQVLELIVVLGLVLHEFKARMDIVDIRARLGAVEATEATDTSALQADVLKLQLEAQRLNLELKHMRELAKVREEAEDE